MAWFLLSLLLLKQAVSVTASYASLACANVSNYGTGCDVDFADLNIASDANCSDTVNINGTWYTIKQILDIEMITDCCNGERHGCSTPTQTTNFSFNCQVASTYNYTSSECDYYSRYLGLNDPALTCDSILSIPESDDFSVSGDFTVMKALAYYQMNNNCCMDGKTRCTGWQNYSFVCLDPSAYTQTSDCDTRVVITGLDDSDLTCNDTLTFRQNGSTWTYSLSLLSIALLEDPEEGVETCCTDGKTKCWVDYSSICQNASAYSYSSECDNYLPLSGIVDPNMACDDTVTIDDGSDNMTTVRDMLNMLSPLYGCCTDGKTKCWVDYSSICLDASAYSYSSECDNYLPLSIPDPNMACDDTVTIDDGSDNMTTVGNMLNMLSPLYGCCTDGKTKCWVDYSSICYDRSAYNYSMCDADILSTGLDIPDLACSDTVTIDGESYSASIWLNQRAIQYECCNDGKSKCWMDYSSLCMNPATYNVECDSVVFYYIDETFEDSCDTIYNHSIIGEITVEEVLGMLAVTTECCSDGVSRCMSPSSTPSITPTITVTPSITPTPTPTISVTPSISVTASASPSTAACTTFAKNCSACMAGNNCIFCAAGCKAITGTAPLVFDVNLSLVIQWYNGQCDTDCPTNPNSKPASSILSALQYCFLSENKGFTAECAAASAASGVSVSVFTALATIIARDVPLSTVIARDVPLSAGGPCRPDFQE
eukprot:g59707.t1